MAKIEDVSVPLASSYCWNTDWPESKKWHLGTLGTFSDG